ncbi:MAG: hypothetical protein LBV55_00845 [Acholeplasmatales bacterium]|jgi:hypothetical protein|nr:hypothetical protein [Acholeplasmatales bacterium]
MNYLRAEGETINVTISMFLGYNSAKDQNASGGLNLFIKKFNVLFDKIAKPLVWKAINNDIIKNSIISLIKIIISVFD